VETCRRYGIHAQTARQVEQTFEQILQLADRLQKRADGSGKTENHGRASSPASILNAPSSSPAASASSSDPLLRCIMSGFIDQLCVRRDSGTLDCDLTEGRHGT